MKFFPRLFDGWSKLADDRKPSSSPRVKTVADEAPIEGFDANREQQISFWAAEIKAMEKSKAQNLPAFYRFALWLREATEGKRLDQELREELRVAIVDLAEERREYLAQLDPEILEMEAQERFERDLLRQEQDLAYLESLMADQAKDAQQREIIDDRPIAPLIERGAELSSPPPPTKRPTLTNSLESFEPQEPPAGERVTKLTLRFPDGSRVTRRFYTDGPLKSIRDFVEYSRVSLNSNGEMQEAFSPNYTMLLMGAPPQPLNDLSITLLQAGLSRPALISIDCK